jgi:O-acetylserine/cysteine efflux transporter
MRPLHILISILVVAIWGGNFIAAKLALSHFPPFFLTGLRFLCVAVLLLPFVPRPDRKQMLAISTIGLFNAMHFSLPYLGMALGLNIASTAITAQLGIPFSCLLAALLMNDKLGKWRTTGLIISFAGMLIVFGEPNVLDHQAGFFAVLVGAIFWGTCNILLKRIKGLGMLQMLAWMAVFTIPPVFAISFIFEPTAYETLYNIPHHAALGLAYTVLISTVIAHSWWYFLLQNYPVTYVAPYSLMTPVCGALFALWFFDEAITWQIIVGGLITLIGVGIIVMRRPKLAMLESEPL